MHVICLLVWMTLGIQNAWLPWNVTFMNNPVIYFHPWTNFPKVYAVALLYLLIHSLHFISLFIAVNWFVNDSQFASNLTYISLFPWEFNIMRIWCLKIIINIFIASPVNYQLVIFLFIQMKMVEYSVKTHLVRLPFIMLQREDIMWVYIWVNCANASLENISVVGSYSYEQIVGDMESHSKCKYTILVKIDGKLILNPYIHVLQNGTNVWNCGMLNVLQAELWRNKPATYWLAIIRMCGGQLYRDAGWKPVYCVIIKFFYAF